jgi:hypothetical protein
LLTSAVDAPQNGCQENDSTENMGSVIPDPRINHD